MRDEYRRPKITNGREMEVKPSLFQIQEWHSGLGEWVSLRNCEYTDVVEAVTKASDWYVNEDRTLRVIEIRQIAVKLFK